MKRLLILILSLTVVLLGVAVIAQTPAAPSEVDAHVAAARAAAGMDYRNTFINLCLPAGGGPGGAARGAARQTAPW